MSHHDTEVMRRAAAARPDLAPRPRKPPAWQRRPWLSGLPVGWAAWLSNRWVSVRDRWFRLRTLTPTATRHSPSVRRA